MLMNQEKSKSPQRCNVADLAWETLDAGEGLRGRFVMQRKSLGMATRNEALGASLYELGPGACSWPYHFHYANTEAIFVLAGQGTLRLAGQESVLRSGDYIVLPPGPEGAHQIINDGAEPLRYLCFSTMLSPDIVSYPDSNKLGLFAGAAPGGPKEKRSLNCFLDAEARRDYWDGERIQDDPEKP